MNPALRQGADIPVQRLDGAPDDRSHPPLDTSEANGTRPALTEAVAGRNPPVTHAARGITPHAIRALSRLSGYGSRPVPPWDSGAVPRSPRRSTG